MALQPIEKEHETAIRRHIAAILGGVSDIGYVIPATLYFNDIGEFWATLDPTADTADEIETKNIAACWFYPVRFSDSDQTDSPLVQLVYELYLFRQFGLGRVNEDGVGDVFTSQILTLHEKFITAYLGIKAEFQRKANVAGLSDADFTRRQTTPVVQVESIDDEAICKFVPGVTGWAVRFEETIEIQMRAC